MKIYKKNLFCTRKYAIFIREIKVVNFYLNKEAY